MPIGLTFDEYVELKVRPRSRGSRTAAFEFAALHGVVLQFDFPAPCGI